MSIFVGRLGLPITPANVLSVVCCSLLNFILADRVAFVIRNSDLLIADVRR